MCRPPATVCLIKSPTRHRRVARFEPWSAALCSASWITRAELAAADWDEAATEVDARVHECRRSPDGSWEMQGRNSSLTRFAELSGGSGARSGDT